MKRVCFSMACGVSASASGLNPRVRVSALTSSSHCAYATSPTDLHTNSPCTGHERALGGGFDIASFTAQQAHAHADANTPTPAADIPVLVRGRAERCRGRGKLGFIHLRQPPFASVQVVCVGKELAKQVSRITPESIIEVEGVVRPAEQPVVSTTCSHYEVLATSLRVISLADTPLPFPLNDTNTKLDTRLNHRPIDMRTPLSAATLRLVSQIGHSFRTRLSALGFMEIHTPKLVPAASEGGSAVFKVAYFDRPAYLAQSPQLYKQMMLMGDAMRVYEIGPVFRAENSLTHRHLTEYVGLDGELVLEKDYTEVLDVLEYVLCGILQDAQEGSGKLLATVAKAALAQAAACQVPSTEHSPSTTNTDTSVSSSPSLEVRSGHVEDVVFEVPESILAALDIGNDAEARASSTDPYLARIGGRGPTLPPSAHPGSDEAATRSLAGLASAGIVTGPRVLRLSFASAVQMLLDANVIDAPVEDFSLQQERRVGQLVKERYGVDVYIIDQFPSSARPFYTMPMDPVAAPYGPTRSFDMYLRGEEICSGAQRIDDPTLLQERMKALNVDPATVTDYVNAFRYGAWPHGGFGLGLERIALFLLGASDIRQVSAFPRDPRRVAP